MNEDLIRDKVYSKDQSQHKVPHQSDFLTRLENELELMNAINKTVINPDTLHTVNHLCRDIKDSIAARK